MDVFPSLLFGLEKVLFQMELKNKIVEIKNSVIEKKIVLLASGNRIPCIKQKSIHIMNMALIQ